MFVRVMLAFLLLSSLFVPASYVAHAQERFEWRYPAYDLRNTNFSPQTAINKGNVERLAIAWLYQVPENPYRIPALAPLQGIETTPLVVNGIVYFATPYNRLVALRSDTGHVVWSYQVNMTEFTAKPYWAYVANQKSIWYHNGAIYMMASDCSVHVLDAANGRRLRLVPGETICNIPGNTGFYWGEQAPVVYRDLVIVRASTASFGGRGFIAAYSLDDFRLVWRWFTVPPAGGDPDWDFKYVVETAGGLRTGTARGNINPYRGDWGSNNLIGGGALWGLIALDEAEGVIYASVGQPSPVYDAAKRPGPNLYTMSIVALNALTGELLWYYQTIPHSLVAVEPGWSVILADVEVAGAVRKVVIAAAKSDYIYVLDARTGQPVYQPVKIGGREMNINNVNAGNNADLTLSTDVLVGKTYCPGAQGGVEAPPAYSNGILYVATQRACHRVSKGPVFYKNEIIEGYISQVDPAIQQNSTLYAVDVRTGRVLWKFEMPNRYQAASVVVSGGVVYAVDRAGILYMLDADSGRLLRRLSLGGLGASGVSIATDIQGEPILLVPTGGGEFGGTYTPGVVAAFKLTQAPQTQAGELSLTELIVLVAVVAAAFLGFVLLSRRGRRHSAEKGGPKTMAGGVGD
ncbi:MAG: PQQ-binding-like beta-propeller repeat protein [Candidatus Caldarchaeum sp.]|nr:PQQ-binding-like beta-propeller repeat protein [Candidatus Caldarchaeum sp.]MDW8359288.1 PQQ-binding-like beta-propeller repeat protein [Candidatus Caldarchaeum sp.]